MFCFSVPHSFWNFPCDDAVLRPSPELAKNYFGIFNSLAQTTELVCFRLQEPKAWDCIRDLGADVEPVKQLPLGNFISYNRPE
jgi:hypothetical protein